jgi:hypothetical protein
MAPLFGYRPDPPDERDRPFAALAPKLAPVGSRGADPFVIPVRRLPKSQVGSSCVANAWTRAREILADLALPSGQLSPELSAQALYWMARQRHGEESVDEGTFLRFGAWVLTNFGTCFDDDWPGNEATINAQPPPRSFVDAYDERTSAYYRIESSADEAMLDAIDAAVCALHPVVYGVQVGEEFVEYDGAAGSVFGPPERSVGGHAMIIIGVRGAAPVRDFLSLTSWGIFGLGGLGTAWFSSEYMKTAQDAWVGTAP